MMRLPISIEWRFSPMKQVWFWVLNIVGPSVEAYYLLCDCTVYSVLRTLHAAHGTVEVWWTVRYWTQYGTSCNRKHAWFTGGYRCWSVEVDTHVDTSLGTHDFYSHISMLKYVRQRFGAEEAHWAHNPRVGGSKLPIARMFFFRNDSTAPPHRKQCWGCQWWKCNMLV